MAVASRHCGDWLLALPIASCGLKPDDEAVRVAVGLGHAAYRRASLVDLYLHAKCH